MERKSWKEKLIEEIRKGKDIIEIMNKLKLFPYRFCLLHIVRVLKTEGFSKRELEKIIEQAKPAVGKKFVENLKKEI
jgi:hypothetical protein